MLVYRLPGPRAIRSASSIARRASRQARASPGSSQTFSMPGSLHDLRLAGHDPAVAQACVQRQRHRRRGHDPAAHRQDAVHLPDAVLEVSALDRVHGRDQKVADGVAGQAALVRAEPMLEQLGHGRFRLGQGDQAVADVADGRDPQLLAEATRGAAVVRDGHDGRHVSGALLDPAQQRREAGAAADRHDPRPARQEPAPVDEVDQRLLRALAERAEQGADDPVRPVGEDPRAGQEQHHRPHPVRHELQRHDRDERLVRLADVDFAIDLSQGEGPGQGERHEPHERDAEPALDADAGPQPAPEIHRGAGRWIAINRAPARDGRRRPARSPSSRARPPVPRRARSSGGSHRCSRWRSSGVSCPRPGRQGR